MDPVMEILFEDAECGNTVDLTKVGDVFELCISDPHACGAEADGYCVEFTAKELAQLGLDLVSYAMGIHHDRA